MEFNNHITALSMRAMAMPTVGRSGLVRLHLPSARSFGYFLIMQKVTESYRPFSPVGFPDVEEGDEADDNIVEPFGSPHTGNGGNASSQIDIDQIADKHAKLQSHGGGSAAGARNRLKINDAD